MASLFYWGFVLLLFFLPVIGYAIFDKTQKSKNHAIGEENFEDYIPRWKDIKTISIVYWVINLYHMVFYLSFHGVATNLNNQIHEGFGFTNIQAGGLVLIYYAQLIFISPIVGRWADKYGKCVIWLISASGLCMIAQLIFALLYNQTENGFTVILPLILVGFSNAVFDAVTWVCLLLALEPNMSAIGYGFATSAMNSFNVLGMFTLGEIQDSTINTNGDYYSSQLFLTGVSLVSIFISVIILVLDKKTLPEDEIEPTTAFEDTQQLLSQEENHKI